ncbi:Cof-type HAD-IIB family hydrolase [Eremococcus coleocola]|uniref:Cof-like hydrolase n=1 Tax=Eremococcus coleocola ACS-139-V-Col8 TaxID=908337 RepID=E4KNL1_9LACT|nr:Cof-type HAD-IIB family hydrolase [Eremococcus coleocola]EFR31456.1 Cof-like hydrolase [Eremococcus coleocola ACS-139-V-Col8]
MIKVFASDMDGTLLNEYHVLSERTVKAIKALQAAGIEFIIATGRAYHSALPLLEANGIKCSFITLNGAVLWDQEGKIHNPTPIEYQEVLNMVDYLKTNQINYSFMSMDNIYIKDKAAHQTRMRKFFEEEAKRKKVDLSEISQAQLVANEKYLKSLDEYDLNPDHSPMKIMIFSDEAQVLQDFQAQFGQISSLDITSSAPDNLEITHKKAQKGIAIQAYLKEKGINMDQVAAIGDSLNDRSMLRMARYSFAMENGVEPVKKIAKYLAAPNTQDGVAQVIEAILAGEYQ